VDAARGRTVFFAQIAGVPAEFAVAGEASVRHATPGRSVAFSLPTKDGKKLQVVLLSDTDSLALWKGRMGGADRVFLTRAGLVLDADTVRLTSADRSELSVEVFPAPAGLPDGTADGVFTRYTPAAPAALALTATAEEIEKAGPARDIPLGKISEPVATEPTDADFAKAAVWRIKLPPGIDMGSDPILRVHYAGDVARFTLNGRLLIDDFYNGNALDLGLKRYAPGIVGGDLEFCVLPLRRDAVTPGDKQRIFMADSARPDFGDAEQVAAVSGVELIPRYTVQLSVPK
jgi:hypothetical protein